MGPSLFPLCVALAAAAVPHASAFSAPKGLPVVSPWGRRHAAPQKLRVQRAALDASAAFQLPPDDVVKAVERAGPKVTVADVASAGGMSLDKAKSGLVALAAALGAESKLEVSRSGDLVYAFPSNVQGALSSASQAAAAREAWNNAKPTLFTALRIAFGLGLFASIAVIYTALIVLSTSSSSSDRDRDDRRSDSGGMGFGGGGFGFGPTLWYGPSPFDLFFYRPYYDYGGYYGEEARPRMGFLEAVYSFVFGDGDPNAGREEKKLAAVASLARRNGGVLTAEQLAPLLDPPEYRRAGQSYNVDESWVLGALTKLNGRPEVTQGGQIVYVFDDLQTTAGDVSRGSKTPILEEQSVPFSLADDGQLFMAGLLGAANLVGAGFLGAKLAALPGGIALPGFLGTVQFAYPALLAYAVGFFAAPVVRYLRNGAQNSEIEARNESRRAWLRAVQSGDVDGKLAEARKYRTATRQVGGAGDTVYSTGESAAKQGTENDMADFDKRLGNA